MKTKKILAALFSAVTAISAVSPFVTNANKYWGSTNPKEFEGLDRLDIDSTFVKSMARHELKDKTFDAFIEKLDDEYRLVYVTDKAAGKVNFTLSADTDTTELKNQIESTFIGCYFSTRETETDPVVNCSVYGKVINDEVVKKIREIVGDKALSFNYENDLRDYYTTFSDLTTFTYTTIKDENIVADNRINNLDETLDLVMDYIEENNLDVKVDIKPGIECPYPIEKWGILTIEPQYEMTPLEHVAFLNGLYEASGIISGWTSPDKVTKVSYGSLDLTNYLNVDSNCDKKQTIADAVAILQFLGNPDDYPLSELGAFNADSDNNGITADDAVRIQQKDAGIL